MKKSCFSIFNFWVFKLVSILLFAPIGNFAVAQTQNINANLNVNGAVQVKDSLKVDSGVYLNPQAIPYNAGLDTSLGIINGRLVRGPGGGGGGSTPTYWQKAKNQIYTDSLRVGIGVQAPTFQLTVKPLLRPTNRYYTPNLNNINIGNYYEGLYIQPSPGDTSFASLIMANVDTAGTSSGVVIYNAIPHFGDEVIGTIQVEYDQNGSTADLKEVARYYIGGTYPGTPSTRYGRFQINDVLKLAPRTSTNLTEAQQGDLHYNSTANTPQFYNGTAWQNVVSSASNQITTGLYFDTLGQTATDTVLNLNIATYQAVAVYLADTIGNILVNFDTTDYPATGRIFDFSVEIIADTTLPAPNMVHTANKFQLQFGVEPSVSTFNNTTGYRRDILTYRSTGTATKKKFKVLIANDFRDN